MNTKTDALRHATDTAVSALATPDERGLRDALDHDGDGIKGGVAPPPALIHMVVIKDSKKHGLTHGEVIAVDDTAARILLAGDTVRAATETEVELAQPRVRLWTA